MKHETGLILLFILMALGGVFYCFIYNPSISSEVVFANVDELHIRFNPDKKKNAPLEGSVTITKDAEAFQKLADWIDNYQGKWYDLEYDVQKPLMDMQGGHTRIQVTEHNIYLIFNNRNGHPRAYEGHGHFEEFGWLWELRGKD
jgi:hypothetical protein